jgi:hypothetical protein
MKNSPEEQRKWRKENQEKSKANAKRAYLVRKEKDPEGHRARQRELMARWRKNNPEAALAADKRSKERGRDRRRETSYKKKYGITIAEFNALFLDQGSACAICRATEPGKNGWQVDHCHNSSVVRGILCHKCNMALGLLGDDVIRLKIAINYLAR